MLEQDGWYLKRRGKGSHVVYRHRVKPGIIILAAHLPGQDVPVGTLHEILKQAGLK